MKETLKHLANQYVQKSASRGTAKKSYCDFDFLSFIKKAKVHDGDLYESTLRDLRNTAKLDPIHIQLLWAKRVDKDHTPPQTIRLNLPDGEQWLFNQIGSTSPTQQRQLISTVFTQALHLLPSGSTYKKEWDAYLKKLSHQSLNGEAISPFHKDSVEKTNHLLEITSSILMWQADSLIRYASAQICGDSKLLQILETSLESILTDLLEKPTDLSDFGIHQKPREVTFHGSLKLQLSDSKIDFSKAPGPVSLSEINLQSANSITTSANYCMTVENKDSFHELAQRNPGILLVLTSHPGSAVVKLLKALSNDVVFLHYGDTDPSGFDILHTLRAKTNRTIEPFLMKYHPAEKSDLNQFNGKDEATIERLLTSDLIADLHEELIKIKHHQNKGIFEQEHIPIDTVMTELQTKLAKSHSA